MLPSYTLVLMSLVKRNLIIISLKLNTIFRVNFLQKKSYSERKNKKYFLDENNNSCEKCYMSQSVDNKVMMYSHLEIFVSH